MLNEGQIGAVLAVKDLESAKKFYGETLGLKAGKEDQGGGMVFEAGSGTKVYVYQSEFAGSNKATALGVTVSDVDAVAADLKRKGVVMEHYDFPGMTMEGDVHVMGEMKTIWFKDPDGNIISVNNMMA
jgi:extradiol dioxygenase family protein